MTAAAGINEFAVTSLIADTMTEFMENACPIYMTANRQFQDEFDRKDLAIGGNLAIKYPGYRPVQYGLSVTAQAIQDVVINYTITENDIRSDTFALNVYEDKFNIVDAPAALIDSRRDNIVDNYAQPSFEVIKNSIETDCGFEFLTNSMYTPICEPSQLGSVNSFASITQLQTFMRSIGLPEADRSLAMNFADGQAVANSQQNQFNANLNQKITMNGFLNGEMQNSRFAGIATYQSIALNLFEAGPLAEVTGITIDSVSEDGTQVTLKGVTASTSRLIKAGDMIAVPSVKLLNNINKQAQRYTLVLKASIDANGDGAGNVTVTLPYPLLASGMHAWIDALPEEDAPVEVFPSINQNYGYTRSGLSLASFVINDIYGALNSVQKPENEKKMPFKVVLQGAALNLLNNYRITNWTGVKAFTPYVVALPSAAA